MFHHAERRSQTQLGHEHHLDGRLCLGNDEPKNKRKTFSKFSGGPLACLERRRLAVVEGQLHQLVSQNCYHTRSSNRP